MRDAEQEENYGRRDPAVAAARHCGMWRRAEERKGSKKPLALVLFVGVAKGHTLTHWLCLFID